MPKNLQQITGEQLQSFIKSFNQAPFIPNQPKGVGGLDLSKLNIESLQAPSTLQSAAYQGQGIDLTNEAATRAYNNAISAIASAITKVPPKESVYKDAPGASFLQQLFLPKEEEVKRGLAIKERKPIGETKLTELVSKLKEGQGNKEFNLAEVLKGNYEGDEEKALFANLPKPEIALTDKQLSDLAEKKMELSGLLYRYERAKILTKKGTFTEEDKAMVAQEIKKKGDLLKKKYPILAIDTTGYPQKAIESLDHNKPEDVQSSQQTEQKSIVTPEADKAAIDWALSNKNDPRAIEILKLHGVQ